MKIRKTETLKKEKYTFKIYREGQYWYADIHRKNEETCTRKWGCTTTKKKILEYINHFCKK